jgi:hypothetical protein
MHSSALKTQPVNTILSFPERMAALKRQIATANDEQTRAYLVSLEETIVLASQIAENDYAQPGIRERTRSFQVKLREELEAPRAVMARADAAEAVRPISSVKVLHGRVAVDEVIPSPIYMSGQGQGRGIDDMQADG